MRKSKDVASLLEEDEFDDGDAVRFPRATIDTDLALRRLNEYWRSFFRGCGNVLKILVTLHLRLFCCGKLLPHPLLVPKTRVIMASVAS